MSQQNEHIKFWQIVMAVVIGLYIFKWIEKSTINVDIWTLLVLLIAYIVVRVGLEQWKQSQEFRAIDKRHLSEVRAEGYHTIEEWHAFGSRDETSKEWQALAAKKGGFKNFDEYMLFHAPDESFRKEWQEISLLKDDYLREEAMRSYDRRRKQAL